MNRPDAPCPDTGIPNKDCTREDHAAETSDEAATEQLAAILAAHRYVYGRMTDRTCFCGWHYITQSDAPAEDAHRSHVAAVIVAAGWRRP